MQCGFIKGLLSEEEIKELLSITREEYNGSIFDRNGASADNPGVNKTIRDVIVSPFNQEENEIDNQVQHKIFKAISAYNEWAGTMHGQGPFEIDRLENPQVLTYTNGGKYQWHQDVEWLPRRRTQRKISCVILLNDASEFEGGELEIPGIQDLPRLTKAGDAVMFPAFLGHRVTPVTSGTRRTIISWGSGHKFR